MPDSPQNSLFSLFAARYGFNTALQLMSLLGYQGSDVGRGIGASQVVGGGLQGLGYLSSNPSLSQLGQGLGKLAGLAGASYGLYNTATNPNLSTKQKAGHAGVQAGEIAGSLTIPYFGLGVAAKAIIDVLRNSGSPQVATAGDVLGAPALPIEGFLSVLQGDKSPRAAAYDMGQAMGNLPGVGGMFRALGIGTPKTTGTMFRKELGSIFDKIPALKSTDLTKYNMPTGGYESYSPQSVTDAQKLGQILAAYAPSGKKSPDAYALQAENILLNRYGNDTSSILSQLLPFLGGKQPTGTQPAIGTQPTGAQPAAAPASAAFGSPGFATMIKQLVQQAAAAQGKAA